MVHENWRFRPHYRQIRQWLDAGRIGPVRQALMTIFTSGLKPDADGKLPAVVRQPFFATEERLLLMEVMIHHVDTLRFLLGPLALDGARLGHACAGVRGEDRATLMMSSPHGAAVVLTGDFMATGYPAAQFDRLEIFGETGTIRLSGTTLELIGATPVTQQVDLDANYKASYRGAISHFLDCLTSARHSRPRPPTISRRSGSSSRRTPAGDGSAYLPNHTVLGAIASWCHNSRRRRTSAISLTIT
jgi:predicted dehydrogenase